MKLVDKVLAKAEAYYAVNMSCNLYLAINTQSDFFLQNYDSFLKIFWYENRQLPSIHGMNM